MAAKVVSFMNLKGGVGKSIIAMLVAEYAVFSYHKRVLLIDFDSQANLTTAMVRHLHIQEHLVPNGYTIYNLYASFLKGEFRPITDFVCPNPNYVSNVDRYPGITLDIAISSPELARLDEEMLTLWENGGKVPQGMRFVLKEALQPALESYDVIIVDCPPGLSLLTSAAIVASDYFISPVIPDPLSILGIELIQNRIAELKNRFPDISIEHAGTILNKVMPWRPAHKTESSRMYGFDAGTYRAHDVGRFRPFHYWIPHADHLLKLGDFECELLRESPSRFGGVFLKYGGTNVQPTNPRGGHPLDRSSEEGIKYYLSRRLDRLTREVLEKIGTL